MLLNYESVILSLDYYFGITTAVLMSTSNHFLTIFGVLRQLITPVTLSDVISNVISVLQARNNLLLRGIDLLQSSQHLLDQSQQWKH